MVEAIITPAAKPRQTRLEPPLPGRFTKNTTAEPTAVIANVKPVPSAA